MIFWYLLAIYAVLESILQRPFLANAAGYLYVAILKGTRVWQTTNKEIKLTNPIYLVDKLPTGIGDASGMALGEIVLINKNYWSGANVQHEQVHVEQWRRWGTIGFLLIYAVTYLFYLPRYGHIGAYERIPFEREARGE